MNWVWGNDVALTKVYREAGCSLELLKIEERVWYIQPGLSQPDRRIPYNSSYFCGWGMIPNRLEVAQLNLEYEGRKRLR